MNEQLDYRQYKFEVGAHQHTHGKHEGKWSPTFKISRTPKGECHVLSGEDYEGDHPDTIEEAMAIATAQVKAWIDHHYDGPEPK